MAPHTIAGSHPRRDVSPRRDRPRPTWRSIPTHVLMEGAPRALVTYQVLAAIAGVDGVVDAHHLHLWSLASDVSAASAHVVLSGHPTLRQAQQTGAQVKAALAERFDLTNVTLELEESPTVVVPNPSPARS